MIPPGQAYRPSGLFNPVSTVFAVIGAVLVSVIVAAIIFAWGIGPIPQLVLITSMVQAFLLGAGLHWLMKKVKLRNPTLAVLIGLFCGAVCVTGVFYGNYLHFVHSVRAEFDNEIAGENLPADKVSKLPSSAVIADKLVLEPKTGHKGFVGYILFANQQGETISGEGGMNKSSITGTALWLLWGAEAFVVLLGGVIGSRTIATHPFCEDCDRWFDKPLKTLWLPKDRVKLLTDAVRSGDVNAVTALAPASVNFDPAPGSSVAELYMCGKCQQSLANVKLRTPVGKKGQYQEKATLKQWSIAPAMAVALRSAKTVVAKS